MDRYLGGRHGGAKVGLVLGGGGTRGAVFHAAALTALDIDLGWDARTADVIVGTSAGAIMGVLLRMGVSGTDLAAMMSEVPQHADHRLVADGVVKPLELPDQDWRTYLPRLSSLIDGSLLTLWRNPAAALLSLLRAGKVDFLALLGFIESHAENTWPERDLRICAVRDDLTRVVWDASSSIDLDAAVSSSCSMPGYAKGVDFDGRTYFDGGLASPTNADVLAEDRLDLVVVLSPMTPEQGRGRSPLGLTSRFAERRLASEVTRLRRGGSEVVVIRSPTRVAQASSGISTTLQQPMMGELAESFFSVGSTLTQLRDVLDPIAAT